MTNAYDEATENPIQLVQAQSCSAEDVPSGFLSVLSQWARHTAEEIKQTEDFECSTGDALLATGVTALDAALEVASWKGGLLSTVGLPPGMARTFDLHDPLMENNIHLHFGYNEFKMPDVSNEELIFNVYKERMLEIINGLEFPRAAVKKVDDEYITIRIVCPVFTHLDGNETEMIRQAARSSTYVYCALMALTHDWPDLFFSIVGFRPFRSGCSQSAQAWGAIALVGKHSVFLDEEQANLFARLPR